MNPRKMRVTALLLYSRSSCPLFAKCSQQPFDDNTSSSTFPAKRLYHTFHLNHLNSHIIRLSFKQCSPSYETSHRCGSDTTLLSSLRLLSFIHCYAPDERHGRFPFFRSLFRTNIVFRSPHHLAIIEATVRKRKRTTENPTP
jgi:hypothetical protein